MARTPFIPPELTGRPFTLEEARAVGLTKSALKGRAWRRLSAELYCWAELSENPLLLLSAWRRLLPAEAAFSGATAGWLFGLDLEPMNPVQIVVPPDSGIRSRVGLSVRRCELPRAEVASIRGLRATHCPLPSPNFACSGRRSMRSSPSTWRFMQASLTLPLWAVTPRQHKVARVQAGCVRWRRMRPQRNRRWKLGFVGF